MKSLISLKYPCRHPKIIGFALAREVESIAMFISTVLVYLNIPPRTLWYDKSCNMYESALLRTPFLSRYCQLVVDRFHFPGQTCRNYFNPDRYNLLRYQRSVAAEVMNSVLERSASFIRYLRWDNTRTYLRVVFALHNFTSTVKDDLNRSQPPTIDLGSMYNERFPCSCVFCAVQGQMET